MATGGEDDGDRLVGVGGAGGDRGGSEGNGQQQGAGQQSYVYTNMELLSHSHA